MADIRCSSCGRDNPDFLDVCQFCQTPLKPEAMVHPGESPTKKNTGELEPILPEWLRDVRQQARESAEEDAAQSATQARAGKEEAPDLLAGLAFQSALDEEEVPGWLAGLSPVEEKTSAAAESSSDFFAQFERAESQPAPPSSDEVGEESPSWMAGEVQQAQPSGDKDELTEWFARTSVDSGESFDLDAPQDEKDAAGDFGSFTVPSSQEPPATAEVEDLGWLRDLEASAKGVSTPAFEEPAPTIPPSSQEDLGWLKNLGGTSAPAFDEPAPTIPPSSEEDLSWLKNLGGTPVTSFEDPAHTTAPSSGEDLSWLNDLGRIEEAPPAEAPHVQPFAAEDEPAWLKNLEGQREIAPEPGEAPHLTPRRTAPLGDDYVEQTMPDWLKSAAEEASMPPPGAASLDWFALHEGHVEKGSPRPFDEQLEEPASPPQGEPASVEADMFAPVSESAALSSQDVDSLFSVDMPDWLSGESAQVAETPSSEVPSFVPEEGDALAPVELPSWVQAMRPVESVIDEVSAGIADQTLEKEGPLAGLRGVIPFAPVGSSRRPKAISLKLQATDEQQAGAALLEQILAGEMTARAIKSAPLVASQRMLRLVLTGLFLLVLTVVIGFGSRAMPVSAVLPADLAAASNVVSGIPENSSVLVVIDYEPSLAGELEAAGGPLLDQMALARHPVFTFLSTSPNGSALVERLMTNTGINKPLPDGLGYQPGAQYFNIGFLPGGSAGVLGFLENPRMAMPAVNVNAFSDFVAVVLLTDHAESSRVWVEQLENLKRMNPILASQSLLVVSSAQAGPLLRPYAVSGQVDGMISGLSDAARYEFVNTNSRPGIARAYWDAFGIGLMMAIALIVLGSLWSLVTKLRAQRAESEQG